MTLDIVRHRLHNQLLSQTRFAQSSQVVAWLGAVQAQDYAGARWAIGLRTKGLADQDVDRAFADGSILRTHLLRPTWHFVTPEDIRWLLALTGPRVHGLNAFMYRKLDVDKSTIKKSYAVLEKSLRDHRYLTREELGIALTQVGIHAAGQRLAYIVMSAELDGVICSGPRKGKQFTYALLEERVPLARELTHDQSLAELVTRYFQSHGPATLQDFCVWSGLTMADAKKGIETVKSQFLSEKIADQIYWFPEIESPMKMKSPTSHLLPNYDEYFIGFKDRSAIAQVSSRAGITGDDPALLANIIILDGQVVGGWRRTLKKDKVLLEASLITKLTHVERQAIDRAAEAYGEFLELAISVEYKEHDHEQRKTRSF